MNLLPFRVKRLLFDWMERSVKTVYLSSSRPRFIFSSAEYIEWGPFNLPSTSCSAERSIGAPLIQYQIWTQWEIECWQHLVHVRTENHQTVALLLPCPHSSCSAEFAQFCLTLAIFISLLFAFDNILNISLWTNFHCLAKKQKRLILRVVLVLVLGIISSTWQGQG